MALRMTISTDPRVDAYAKLLVERCLDVQPGMEVLIRTTHMATPAVLALQREIARRGAHPILRIGFVMWPTNPAWAAEAPEELLGSCPRSTGSRPTAWTRGSRWTLPRTRATAPTFRRSAST